MADPADLELVDALLGAAATAVVDLARPEVAQTIAAAARAMGDALGQGRTVYFCGNGGSAAEASHLAAELSGRLVEDRPALPGVSLAADPATLTALGNDYGFERLFARQVEALGRSGDVLVLLTTSGRSVNVIEAARTARGKGMITIAVAGPAQSPLDDIVDHVVHVGGSTSGLVQVGHLAVGLATITVAERIALDHRAQA